MRNLTLALCLAAAPAAADVDATDAPALLDLMLRAGYDVSLTRDGVGDPKIDGRLSETDWSLFFYGCTDGAACRDVQFSAGYDLPDGISFTRINEWNRVKRYGTAFVDDENDPFVQMPVNLFGGVTEESFLDTVDWWRIVIEEFEEHVGW